METSSLYTDFAITDKPDYGFCHYPADIVLLTPSDIPGMLDLQNRNQDGNTIFRDAGYLRQHFEKANIACGVQDERQNLAAMVLMSRMDAVPHPASAGLDPSELKETHALIGCAIVDVPARGRGWLTQMLKTCELKARHQGIRHLHACVIEGNGAVNGFMKYGFVDLGKGVSPSDPARRRMVNFLHYKIQ